MIYFPAITHAAGRTSPTRIFVLHQAKSNLPHGKAQSDTLPTLTPAPPRQGNAFTWGEGGL